MITSQNSDLVKYLIANGYRIISFNQSLLEIGHEKGWKTFCPIPGSQIYTLEKI